MTRDFPEVAKENEVQFDKKLFLKDYEIRKYEGGLRLQNFFKNNLPEKPLITIITVVLNRDRFLEKTINSIINQTYDNVEYIIIDGGSIDGTVDIIRKYEHALDYWISEKDKGISDAFNKGVKLSTGELINFQGDGDGFVDKNVLSKVAEKSLSSLNGFVCGKIRRTDLLGEELYISKQIIPFNKKSLLYRMSLPHQGLFTRRSFFDKYGLFDVNNTYCMDYEHLLRAYDYFPEVVFVEDVIANWRDDGIGNGNTLKILREYHKIKKK